jgi:ATP-dependent Zn protease
MARMDEGKLVSTSFDNTTACKCAACGHDITPSPPPIDEFERQRLKLERQDAAYHESGHLCVAWALGAEVFKGTIRPYGLFRGLAIYGHDQAGEGADCNRVVSLLAGQIAERRFNPRSGDGAEGDRERVSRLLVAMCRSPAAAKIVRAECAVRAEKLVAANWDAIEAVALALIEHETLSGDELNLLLEDVEIDRKNSKEPARRAAWREVEKNADEFLAVTTRRSHHGGK